MDSYISAAEENRRQAQVFGPQEELRVLRTLNARANAMRRMAGNRTPRAAVRVTKATRSTQAGGGASHRVA